MVRASLLLTVVSTVLVAACGSDSSHKKVDAAVNPDSPEGNDALDLDAPADAPVTMVMSRVWAVGDFLVDQQLKAGGFTDGATLPFTPTTPPPLVVPAGTSVLPGATGYNNDAEFDASRDGAHTAFVADLGTAGTFDLYTAAGDGSNPQKLVDGAMNVEISSVAISPDGTKVAYLADVTVNGGYDLYVVNTTGTPAPVKVSPDRPTANPNQDVFYQVTWSADSRYLAFSADLTLDGVDQPWCVDTMAATPTAVALLATTAIQPQTMGAQGVRGALLFDKNNNVYFRARVTTGGTFDFFKGKPDGSMTTAITASLPKRTDMSTPDIGAFAVSPDGAKLVVSADSPTLATYNLYALDPETLTDAVNLTNATTAGSTPFTTPMWISPDGTQIAYLANFMSARNEPYVAKLDGSGAHRLVDVLATCAGCASPDANTLQWTADGKRLYVRGDLTSNNDTKIYALDPTMTDQAPVLAVDVPTAGDMTALIVRKQ